MRVVTLEELKPLFGIPYHRVHIGRLIKAGQFPQPVQLGKNRIVFLCEEVEHWIEEKAAKRDRAA